MKPITHNKLTDTKYNKPKPIPSFLKPNPISSYIKLFFNTF